MAAGGTGRVTMCRGDDPTCAAYAEHRRRFRAKVDETLAPERRAFLKSGFAAPGGAAALAAGGLSLVTPALAQTSAARAGAAGLPSPAGERRHGALGLLQPAAQAAGGGRLRRLHHHRGP